MKTRFKVLSLLVAVVTGLPFLLAREEPTEQRLRKALQDLQRAGSLEYPDYGDWITFDRKCRQELRVVRGFGTNALPVLEKWLRKPTETGVRLWIYNNLNNFPALRKIYNPRWAGDDRRLAVLGCWALGAEAAPLIPQIVSLVPQGATTGVVDNEQLYDLGSALAGFGTNSVPGITFLFSRPNPVARDMALNTLWKMPQRATNVVSVLLADWGKTGDCQVAYRIALHAPDDFAAAFISTNLASTDLTVRGEAASSLRLLSYRQRTNVVLQLMPEIKEALSDTNSHYEVGDGLAYAVSELGLLAAPLFPVLSEIAKTNSNIRSYVQKIGSAIAAEEHRIELVLAEERRLREREESIDLGISLLSEPDWASRRNAADHLAGLGQPAQRALPALEEVAKDPFPPVRDAAREAIRKIRGGNR